MTIYKQVLSILLLLTCSLIASAAECQRTGSICTDTTPVKNISGFNVTIDQIGGCWEFEDTYQCQTSTTVIDECQPLRDKGCAQIGSKCVEFVDGGSGKCSLYEQKYQCLEKEGSTSTVLDCGNQTYCMDGKCVNAGYASDTDFSMAMAGMETARQMGNYMDHNTLTLFNGSASKCTITLGVFNCCQKNTKAGSDNGSMMSQVVNSVAMSFGGEAVRYLGSNYVFDSLYANDGTGFLAEGFSSLLGGGGGVVDMDFNPTLSFYGVTAGFGFDAGITMLYSNPVSGFYVGFDPTSFAISVAIQIVMSLMSCDEDEQVLALKRGQNLCHHIGSYCSDKVLGVCVEKKQSYCCFNSRLARLVSVEGHAQLGKSWGSEKNPNCSGFTMEEIALVDFSKINFNEVLAEFKANIKLPTNAIGRAQDKIQNFYQQQ